MALVMGVEHDWHSDASMVWLTQEPPLAGTGPPHAMEGGQLVFPAAVHVH
eukprot:CAMPEP_0174374980 /NCGR_PEP_ID=MMETSP0811_2-20130205/112850_1 /TAXON_ID=73025 ORGANISM="Eutreptiella gymnastica-like, Strain CCMP1594" /NCGR_SAMPLE_ID=MMETSP0811_2 /ASSEMBLY_ACC=CAM_ASM_000667 /LENGTH=49 /DNA_ID=CAMNT_0015524759 /DNA_START=542 /DNA_END=691 /DNA_ORIENTATION=+